MLVIYLRAVFRIRRDIVLVEPQPYRDTKKVFKQLFHLRFMLQPQDFLKAKEKIAYTFDMYKATGAAYNLKLTKIYIT
jgi:hypothetical protein